MAEYIDKQRLYGYLCDVLAINCSRNRVLNLIYDWPPTADVVEVVRCEKCRHSRPLNRKDSFENMICDGAVWCLLWGDGVMTDDFCSNGTRMDGGAGNAPS